jgi:hypothetical protein
MPVTHLHQTHSLSPSWLDICNIRTMTPPPRLGSVLKRMEPLDFVSKNNRLEKERKTNSQRQSGDKGNMIQRR